MPKEGILVRYGEALFGGWKYMKTFETTKEAEDFIKTIKED